MKGRGSSWCRRAALAVTLSGVAWGCESQPELHGVVTDIFDRRVSGATVVVEGQSTFYFTDVEGGFTVPWDGSATARLMAGRDGFVKAVATVGSPEAEPGSQLAEPVLVLFPEPPSGGLFSVGKEAYDRLEPTPIVTLGTEFNTYTGLRAPSLAGVERGRATFVLGTGLGPDEIRAMDLQLYALSFVDRTPVRGLLGDQEVAIRMWVPATRVPFELEGTLSQRLYTIRTVDILAPGTYAFAAQGVLSERSASVLSAMPAELRVAYAFVVPD